MAKKAAKSTKRKAAKATKATKRKATKRQRLDTGTDTRFVRRSAKGRFEESDDVGKASTSDRRMKARTKVKSGQGDKGDR